MREHAIAHPGRWLWRSLRRFIVSWASAIAVPAISIGGMIWAFRQPPCDTWVVCRYREGALSLGEAIDLPAANDTTTMLDTPAWLYVTSWLILSVLMGIFVSWQYSQPRPGPVIVEKVVEANGQTPIERLDLKAIIMDRLARAGVQAPSTVPASVMAPPLDQPPSSLTDVPGLIARLAIRLAGRNTERVGYSIEVTLRESERINQRGMTFVVSNRTNGRQLTTDTIWAPTEQEAARVVAFHVAALIADLDPPPSTVRAPAWAPSSTSLRSYEDASYFIETGRFDEAIISCSAGLENDPASLPLRYLLGTLHERLGHFLSAIDTYVTAINILIYDGTAFSRPKKADGTVDKDMPGLGRRIGRRIISDEATQIVWRYTVALTFAHRWSGRWLHDLRRADGEYPSPPLGYEHEIRTSLQESAAALGELNRIEGDELRDRAELAKRLRGFFHRRYHELMRQAFPVLDACVFGESRQAELLNEQIQDAKSSEYEPPELTDDLIECILGAAPSETFDEKQVGGWFVWLIGVAIDRADDVSEQTRVEWMDRLESWQAAPAGRTVARFSASEPDRDTCSPEELQAALRNLLELLSDRDRAAADQHFSRQRLAMVAYQFVPDLLAMKAKKLSDEDRSRLEFLLVQLDLQLFFLRCSQVEMELLGQRWPWRRRELFSWPFLSRQLVESIQRATAYRCRERLCELIEEAPPDPGRQPNHPLLVAKGVAEAGPGWWGWTSERLRGWITKEGDWNLWYYEACARALTVSRSPDLMVTQPQQPVSVSNVSIDPVSYRRWVQVNDKTAARAVNALNQAVGVRRARGQNAIDAGAREWLFHQDPGLDRLRPHLRFRRWSDGLFKAEDGENTFETADRALWLRNSGRYGAAERKARLASETFTIDLLSGPIRQAASYLADQADQLDGERTAQPAMVWEILERDRQAWRDLVGIPRFIGNPRLRATAWRRIKAVATTQEMLYAAYPTTTQAFRRARLIPIFDVVGFVASAIDDSDRVLAAVDQARRAGSLPVGDAKAMLTDASTRWWTLLAKLNPGAAPIDITPSVPGVSASATDHAETSA